ncbi:hypothetical protein Vretimale_2404 [Volvox reticuliferus]|nr:hypothetical protein Vretifemale_4696 [Volvox reticuliferus]GIL96621.1 hypothetical protein Vretimale_2404 [Volvox reticuliferus]
MRDYGFIVPGNTNDRIKLPNQDTLPALNGASLLEALGIKGDWRNGGKLTRVHPETSPGGEPANLLALARQKSAVLSMNLSDGFPSPKGGGLFGRWPGATSWTDAGRPPPQRLNGSATTMTTERAAVATVRQSYQAALDELPTSIAKDESLLLAHDQASGGAAVPLPSRVAAAVRCRLEHKLLLAEAVRALEIYDIWLHERLRLGRLVG